jgi:molybdenum cofactor synthesis domain-containing protein
MRGNNMSKKYRVAVVTMSDKGSLGQRVDESGPLIAEMMEKWGLASVEKMIIIPDEFNTIKETLISLSDDMKVDLILTTGGTGLSPRDVTPEATMAVADRNVPGIAEYMRAKSFEITPKAMLSRAVSVMRRRTLIINLPGSPKAVRENLEFILPTLDHGLEIMTGRGGECGNSK